MTMSMLSLLPGFRFNPTDEELIFYYLRKRVASEECPAPVIADVDIYKFDPWDLPSLAVYGVSEWYFFSPRDRKYPNGMRPNRAAGSGYWKSTGTDKPIYDGAVGKGVGVKKALSFYEGSPPRGIKTGWVMHEYRIAAADTLDVALNKPLNNVCNVSMRLDDWVLCRIYKTGQPSPMVPQLTLTVEDYGHLVGHDDLSGGGSFLHSSSSSGTCRSAITTQNTSERHPMTPFINDHFDEYLVADSDSEHLAVHPSLNHLFHDSDMTQVEPLYYAPALWSSRIAGGGAGKRKATSLAPEGSAEEAQRVVLGPDAAAVVPDVVSEWLASVGAAWTQPSDASSRMLEPAT